MGESGEVRIVVETDGLGGGADRYYYYESSVIYIRIAYLCT